MNPADPLIQEHRLIERMVGLLEAELRSVRQSKRVSLALLETAVDFFRTYADRCHHGKEEFILFRKLEKKNLAPELQKIMEELVEDHVRNREWVESLAGVKSRYARGEKAAIQEIERLLSEMTDYTSKHMEKEEKKFFAPALANLSPEEKNALLAEEYEFDRNIIHEKYRLIIEKLEPAALEARPRSKK